MTTAALMRTASAPVHSGHLAHHNHAGGISLYGRGRRGGASFPSPRSLHVFAGENRRAPASFRRAQSEADLVGSDFRGCCRWTGTAKAEEEDQEEGILEKKGRPGLRVLSGVGFAAQEEVEQLEFAGGGVGNGRRVGGGGGGGGREGGKGGREGTGGDQSEMGAYYQEMLEADPGNPLLLRNYGRFLHEVEGDVAGAEECYGRAILESPGDGEVLSLYGKLIWDAHRDETRAEAYFERAVEASPDDCYVLGSYAHFLWDAEEEEDKTSSSATSPPSLQQQPHHLLKAR